MKILYFDTETTGMPRKQLPLNHPDQPRLVQLGAILCEFEPDTEYAAIDLVVATPKEIPQAAAQIHGITPRISEQFGVLPVTALSMFNALLAISDAVCAHNLAFDLKIMQIEAAHTGTPLLLGEKQPQYCTMELSTEVLKLPGPYGKPKWPKLTEAYQHFTGEPFKNAHSAYHDAQAARKVLNALVDKGHARI